MTGDTMPPTAKCLAPLWSKVLPANEVLSDAMQLAKRLAVQNSVLSMALNKALLWRTPSTPEKTHLLDSACVAASAQASDASEGTCCGVHGGALSHLPLFQALFRSWRNGNLTSKEV